jgi:hypothetical protein
LFAEPSAPLRTETEGQRINRLTKIYTDQVKLSNFHGVRSVVAKAVQDSYTDDQITIGLNRLRTENRVVSANALKIAMDGQPRSSNSYQDGRPVRSTTTDRLEQADAALAELKRMMHGSAA